MTNSYLIFPAATLLSLKELKEATIARETRQLRLTGDLTCQVRIDYAKEQLIGINDALNQPAKLPVPRKSRKRRTWNEYNEKAIR